MHVRVGPHVLSQQFPSGGARSLQLRAFSAATADDDDDDDDDDNDDDGDDDGGDDDDDDDDDESISKDVSFTGL